MLSWRCLFFETDLLMRPVSRRHCLDDRFLLSVHVGGYGLPRDFGNTAGHMFDVGCFFVASAPIPALRERCQAAMEVLEHKGG